MGMRRVTTSAALVILMCTPCARGQEARALEGCKAYVGLAQADAGVMNLLSTPAVPPSTSVFAAQSAREVTEWDLPSKVTRWKDRPSAAELAQRWEELNRRWYGARPGETAKSVPAAIHRPYQLLRIAPADWSEVEKWMTKEMAKHASGLCYYEQKATYVFVSGAIRDPAASVTSQARTLQYTQSAGLAQPEGYGPGGHPAISTGHNAIGDEFDAAGSANDSSVYACVFLFRAQGAARQATPEYYYCHSASSLKSSLGTMLKFLTKQGVQ